MNKSDLKNFAINARLELLRRVSDRAALYGISEKAVKDKFVVPSAAFHKIDGTPLTASESERRNALIVRASQIGYRPAMEEAAYTWFNRFVALKYLQEHNLLPVAMRVLPDAPGVQPQILREAQDVSLPNVDLGEILSMLDGNRTDELYKYLLLKLCAALSETLPGMFREISGATELLFPDGLLRSDSVLGELANLPADCWSEIQVVGWLYQYYNTQLKDETFELLKKNVKITKDRIGAATQLFTPEWIVRYMVENSLGRLWLEGHPDENLRMKWRYFMDEAQQLPEVAARLAELRAPYASLQPEAITVLDPCMGSGHILVYAFDVLMQIYRSVGYTDRDAVQSIVQNNLYGLDIDDRAAQLAYFAVMMKACEYDRRFLRRGVQPHVCAVQESAPVDAQALSALGAERSLAERLMQNFTDAKEYGSILHVNLSDGELARLSARLDALESAAHENLLAMADSAQVVQALRPLVNQAQILNRKYDIVITNPPYMGSSGMNAKLSDYVKTNYPDSKSDLSTCFMEKTLELCSECGYMTMINIPVWMFLSSYEKLRERIITESTFVSMVHPGRGIFGSDFGTTTFVIAKRYIHGYKGSYRRLFDKQGEVKSIEEREQAFLNRTGEFTAQQDNFKKIPGSPIAYWVSERVIDSFVVGKSLKELGNPRVGLQTSDNDSFLRLWQEIAFDNFERNCKNAEESLRSNKRWYPHNKGGRYRKWYGNLQYVIDYKQNGEKLAHSSGAINLPDGIVFRKAISFSRLGSGSISFRWQIAGEVFDSAAVSVFPSDAYVRYVMGVLNTNLVLELVKAIAPTINTQPGDIARVPIIIKKDSVSTVDEIVEKCTVLSKTDWDSFETSWDFKKHPMI